MVLGVEAGSWGPVCVQEPHTASAQPHGHRSPCSSADALRLHRNPLWSVLELKLQGGSDHSP